MFAVVASLIFTAGFMGSIALIVAMLYDKRETIVLALLGEHIPQGAKPAPVLLSAPRHARRTMRRLAPPPSLAQIRRAAIA